MSHNPEDIEVNSEASAKSDQLDDGTQGRVQGKSSVAAASQERTRLTKSSKRKDALKRRSQQKLYSVDSGQQENDSTKSKQMQIEPTQSNHQNAVSTKRSLQKIESIESSQEEGLIVLKYEEREGQENSLQLNQTCQENETSRNIAGYFNLNTKYIIQVRGAANIIHIVLSLTDAVLLSLICQLRPYSLSRSEGFYCKPPKMFLFIVSCSSLITATLYFFCCVLSKTTASLLFESSFEVGYFIMYFILFLTAGLILFVSEETGVTTDILMNDIVRMHEYDRKIARVAVIIGLINSVIYGFSAIWFLSSHCDCKPNEQIDQNQTMPKAPSEVRHSI